jgi:trans-aconitate 2-methyltransferase
VADWNPIQYLKFANERTQPSLDLAGRIATDDVSSILDVGCGPGNSTQVLRTRWPDARITGLDNSKEMIAEAEKTYPDGNWVVGDASQLSPPPTYDVVFSNAVLQWVPDHRALIPRLLSLVNKGGILAVQVPANSESPLHHAVWSASRQPRWNSLLAPCRRLIHYHSADFYYDLLRPTVAKLDLWETVYFHALPGHRELIEWYKGSGMRPFLEKLADDGARATFEAEVLERCKSSYPLRKDGRILFPFKRLFFIAHRA